MCETCGCGEPESYQIRKAGQNEPVNNGFTHTHFHSNGEEHAHDHPHSHSGDHDHDHDLEPGHSHEITTSGAFTAKRSITLGKDILEANNLMAERNRSFFESKKVFCVNLVSSPGSGKTSLLERTIAALKEMYPVYVIEGDQQSMLDADRIAKLGIPVVQINTGSGCHLDAHMVNRAINSFDLTTGSLLFIENVGNLVCPALFDLGEATRVLVMSVTEGEDKPLKYPAMFRSSQLCLINKTDLLPYVDFRVEIAKKSAGTMNSALEFLEVSAKTGEGMDAWTDWIIHKVYNTGN